MSAVPEAVDWNALAFEKLRKVLGEERARSAMQRALQLTEIDSLRSADDLYRFAQELTAMPGFVRAVGGMLSLHAVMAGAGPER